MSEKDIQIGKKLFSWRDYTPIPLILLILIFHRATVLTATLGMLAIMLGELIRIYSVAFIGGVSRTRSDSTGQQLVTDGPFGWVRNPLYVGNFFITLGVAVYAGVPWLMVVSVIAFAGQYYFIVKYEESILTTKFPADYPDYKKTVPPWIPKKLPRLKDMVWPSTFAPALQSEKRTFTAIFCMLLVLVLLSL